MIEQSKSKAFQRLLAKAWVASARERGDVSKLLGAGLESFYRLPLLVSTAPERPVDAETNSPQAKRYRAARASMKVAAWRALVMAVAMCRAERVRLDYSDVPYLPKAADWFNIASRAWSAVLEKGGNAHLLCLLVEDMIALCLYGCQRWGIPGMAIGEAR